MTPVPNCTRLSGSTILNRKLASFLSTILPLPISNMSSLIRHFSKWPMRLYGTPTICNLSKSILTSFYIHSQGALNHTFWFQIHTGNTWFISFMWPVVYAFGQVSLCIQFMSTYCVISHGTRERGINTTLWSVKHVYSFLTGVFGICIWNW